MNNTLYDLKSPHGQLYDDVIVTVPRTYYLRDGDVVDREEHEVYVNDGYKATHCWGDESTDDFA
jgi:hypothetical protein